MQPKVFKTPLPYCILAIMSLVQHNLSWITISYFVFSGHPLRFPETSYLDLTKHQWLGNFYLRLLADVLGIQLVWGLACRGERWTVLCLCPLPWQPHEPCWISRSFFVSGPKFTKLFSSNVGKIVVDNAVFRLSIAWSVPEIFTIKVYSCPKSSLLLITREPLHLDWWNFARTCTSTSFRTLLNFKVKGQVHMVFFVFFCVHNAAATCWQYLASLWSCFRLEFFFFVRKITH